MMDIEMKRQAAKQAPSRCLAQSRTRPFGRMSTDARRFVVAVTLALGLGLMASPISASEYEITQWTIASGGVIEAESTDGQWKLSGTIGQWEATEARALSGGPWRLTGGFWALSLEELADLLFRDRFEGEETDPASE
jgi:hypothetical protein